MDKLEKIKKGIVGWISDGEKIEPYYGNQSISTKDLDWLISEIGRLKKALEFYANDENYCLHENTWTWANVLNAPVYKDLDIIAKQALKEE